MEGKKPFYTVAEAAELLCVSRQAIYQALNKSLKPFSSKVDGRIVIESAAFSDVVDKQLNKQNDKENDNRQSNIQALVQEVDKLKIQLVEAERREKMLIDQLEYLKQQIKIKDEMVEGLRIALDQQQKLQLLTQQPKRLGGGFFRRLFGHKDE